jgi:predicted acyl esterase
MRPRTVLLIAALFVVPALAGCLTGDQTEEGSDDPRSLRGQDPIPIQERVNLPYDTTGDLSVVLTQGLLEMLPVQSINISVELPLQEGGAALLPEGGRVHIGLWLPDVPEGTKVPVIADAGPYYESENAALEPYYFTQNLIDNLGPHGYAIAQVSVMGTGWSNHCMDLMGRAEQLGIDAAVTWLGTQDWSNGNVGMAGKSYDGSTPWQAAMFGNPHLRTIVPASGLIGMHDLMWRNGSAETRGPIMHNGVYGRFAVDNDEEDIQNLCPDYVLGPGHGGGAWATGGENEQVHEYWAERHFLARVLDNYNGSVLLVQGLQDWNVDPHMAFPTHHLLEDAGIEVKGIYGQWAHSWPDQRSHHEDLSSGRGQEAFPLNMRYDFQQALLEWCDYYLKEEGPKPDLRSEVQDNLGQWRLEESYPPRDATLVKVPMSSMTQTVGEDAIILPSAAMDNDQRLAYLVPALSETEDTQIAGNVLFHATVTPTGPGGQIFAHLADAETGLRLGHAIMDLRYHAGGKQSQDVTPGEPILAKMEFEALDVQLPAGHGMILTLAATGEGYLPSSVSQPVMVDAGDASNLIIPTVDRAGQDVFFTPPVWYEEDAAAEE